jgi:hypothetical protein
VYTDSPRGARRGGAELNDRISAPAPSMRVQLRTALLAGGIAATCGLPAGATNWSGPALRLMHTGGGFPALELTRRRGGPTVTLPPHWLNLNNQGSADVPAIVEQLTRARLVGMPLVCVVLSDSLMVPPVSAGTRQLMELVQQHHPTAVVLVRWLIESFEYLPRYGMRKQDIGNTSRFYTTGMNSPSSAWATSAAANFSLALHGLDEAFPGMIAGVQLEGLETGEWFLPPAENGNDNSDNVPGLFVGDYSDEMTREFCAAEGDQCGASSPSASERNTATLGNALLQWDHRSAPAARSARFNHFLSQRVVGVISLLAEAIKRETGGTALALAFYCYLFELSDSRLPGSGHLACAELESGAPQLDGIASPYQYGTYARAPGGQLTTHGPIDSPGLHGKVWMVEDDTRTVLAAPDGLRFATTVNATVNILRRNAYTAMLHKAGIYWLDLACQGWFGRPDNATTLAATSAIWTMAAHVRQQWSRLLGSPKLQLERFPSEVAIFVDEQSAAAGPLLGLDGTLAAGSLFEPALIRDPWHALAGIGAPVRVFLLSDLHLPTFPAGQFKLCVFLNAIAIGPSTRDVIREKLETNNKSLVWVYAPGLLGAINQSVMLPNITATASLTGLPLRTGAGNSSLISTFVKGLPPESGPFQLPVSLAGAAYGGIIPGAVAPWLYSDEVAGVTVLARYATGNASIATARVGTTHSSTFIGTPGPPTALWRALARAAGVHMFVDDHGGDAVETGGAGLLFLAGGQNSTQSQRSIHLPGNFTVSNEFGNVVCSEAAPCTSFQTAPMGPGENRLYWLTGV